MSSLFVYLEIIQFQPENCLLIAGIFMGRAGKLLLLIVGVSLWADPFKASGKIFFHL